MRHQLLSDLMRANGAVEAVATQAARQRDHERLHGDPFQRHLPGAVEALVKRSDWRSLPRQTKRDMAMMAVAGEELRRKAELEEFQRAGIPKRRRREDDVEAFDEEYGDGEEYEDEDATLDGGIFDEAAQLVARAPLVDSATISGWLDEISAGELRATAGQYDALVRAHNEALEDDRMLAAIDAEREGAA